MNLKTLTTLAASITFLGLVVVTVSGQDKVVLKDWKAEPASVKKLGNAVTVEGFSLRIPKGYESIEMPSPANVKFLAWAGPVRKNKSRPMMLLISSSMPNAQEESKNKTLEQSAADTFAGMKSTWKDCKEEKPESGTINGMKFIRYRYVFTPGGSTMRANGISYMTRDGDRLLVLSTQDLIDAGRQGLLDAEAAFFTLKKVAEEKSSPGDKKDQPGQSGWTPDPAQLKKLGEPVTKSGYSLRPPKGYELQEKSGPYGIIGFAWLGPQRPDLSRPGLFMIPMTLLPEEQEKYKDYTLEQVADRFLNVIKAERRDWKREKAEFGSINGIDFVRVRWSGINIKEGAQMRGFVYAARDEKTWIGLWSQDYVVSGNQGLAVAEAAILTFRKK